MASRSDLDARPSPRPEVAHEVVVVHRLPWLAVLLGILSLTARAQGLDAGASNPDLATPYTTLVEGTAPTTAASAESFGERDLALRPRATPEDLLRVVPGLVVVQHQGGGKADQLFLRGFDADHGTDVALDVDGVPINMPSHAHGQGFADLHFLIPETVERVDLTKGPYWAESGDFDTAGAVHLRTRRSFADSSVAATYGSFQTYRVLGIASPKMSDSSPWLAAEVGGTQGPFRYGENLERYNVFGKDTLALGPATTVSILATLYGSQWRASGQLPLRAVESGLLDRFGSIDPTEGGQTQRDMLVATLDHQGEAGESLQLTVYGIRYSVALFSDFTFQLRDPVNFDEIEQDDQRLVTGLNARYRRVSRVGSVRLTTTFGAQARYDDIRTQLWHDKARQRLPACFDSGANPCDSATIGQSDIGEYLQEDMRVNRFLRIVVGVRADEFDFDVQSQKPPSGAVQRAIVNPKLQVVVQPTGVWDLYFDAGGGFHSNDARSVVANGGSGALPRALGAEVGTRLHPLDKLELACAVWDLHLQSEQTFDADEDTTSPAGPTNRYGVDLELRYRLLPWLWADGDLSLAHAAYTEDHGNGNAVALAPTRTAAAGLTALHPDGYQARLGMRYVGSRAATQDGSLRASGYTLLDLTLAYRRHWWEVGLIIENLLNAQWAEAQFAGTSQLRMAPYNEAQPVTGIHFTPGAPIRARLTLAAYF